MANLGYSFQPGAESVPVSGSNRAINGPQSAVEVRSLTLPNRFVPGQIAPQQLLQSAGGGGAPELTVLRQLMQAFAPQGQQPGVPQLAPPMGQRPRMTSGIFGLPGVLGGFGGGGGMTSQPGGGMTSQPGGGSAPPPHVTPGDTGRPGPADNYGAIPNPYTDPANYAPAPDNPQPPLSLPAPQDYHFGQTPPQRNPLGRKFDEVPGLFD